MQQSAATELQHLLATPPAGFQGSTNNPAAVAHAALQTLRDSGDERFLFLRTVLELQHDATKEELLFHCVTGCRHVILYKWVNYSGAFRDLVRDYFMALGQQASLPRTVRVACCSTCASFWKRQWNDESEQDAPDKPVCQEEQTLMEAMKHQLPGMPHLSSEIDLFHYLDTLLQPSSNQIASAATFLSVLLGEFMGKSAVQYHLPLEFHKRAHEAFESDRWLDQSLKLSMTALSHVVSAISKNPGVRFDPDLALAVVQSTIDVISWEFGSDAWDGGIPFSSGKTLLRPPVSWGDYLIRPDFCGAIFHVHDIVCTQSPKLAHALRQLLLLLASLSGPIFVEDSQRFAFATYLVDGTLKLLSSSVTAEKQQQESSELLDVLSMVCRLIANFKLSTLVKLPTLEPLLNAITSTGTALLQANAVECERVHGDIESMEHGEWREEALTIVLDGAVLLCGDPWLLYAGTEESRKAAQSALAKSLAPLYTSYLSCRTRMARLEELYLTANAAELDEVREEISTWNLEQEMTSAAAIGRLHLSASLTCLSSLLQPVLPQLQALWDQGGSHSVEITPENAALLEEARLLTMCVSHLLTDDNEGESPVIPESVVNACVGDFPTTNAIASMVQSLLPLAELQASKIAVDPSNPRLSPLLAKSFLWFLNRWAPAYIIPSDYGVRRENNNGTKSDILSVWASPESAQHVASFCITLCLHYHCYWPLERQVQEGATLFLLSLAKRGPEVRQLMISSPSFHQLVSLHSLTAGMRHNAPPSELEAAVQAKGASAPPINMVRGYQRLPYDVKSQILTVLLVASSETKNETATAMLNECFGAVHSAFHALVHALASKQVTPDDVNAREMACLCVEMYGGVARASEMAEPERIPQFVTPSLPQLSGLMLYYAEDLTICESLLILFRDYAEQFVAVLNRDQCLTLFNASAELLKSYSAHHVSSRVIKRTVASAAAADAEEEQSYSDVLCAIQLLIHLGTKDFIDICSSATEAGVDSSQVTDVIFFGLQQIIPLMTQGLLQFPTLCTQYFSLVGFMMDTYPEKVCVLPYELFDALLESLLFGMSHVDSFVSKSSLRGVAGIAREHLQTKCLAQHLAQHPDIFDKCFQRLLQEVIFQPIVWDRLEPAGMALLPLAAVDINRFVAVVNGLTQQISPEQQPRLQAAFQTLIKPEVLAKVASGGYEGRMNRVRFKKDFDVFVKEIHSFLVLK